MYSTSVDYLDYILSSSKSQAAFEWSILTVSHEEDCSSVGYNYHGLRGNAGDNYLHQPLTWSEPGTNGMKPSESASFTYRPFRYTVQYSVLDVGSLWAKRRG